LFWVKVFKKCLETIDILGREIKNNQNTGSGISKEYAILIRQDHSQGLTLQHEGMQAGGRRGSICGEFSGWVCRLAWCGPGPGELNQS
jgi:hypothetical protein